MDKFKKRRLSKDEIKKTKSASVFEGSCYEAMYGFGEQYLVPYALKLGASGSEVAILSSVPVFLGTSFQLIGGKLIDWFKDRKKLAMLFVLLQALSLLPLFLIPFFTGSIFLLGMIFSIYQILGAVVGPIWSSWLGDVVPARDRAPYFAYRSKVTVAVQFLSLLAAGSILSFFTEVNIWTGFAVLFTIAFIGRVLSWQSFKSHFEPAIVQNPGHKLRFIDFLQTMHDSNLGNFVIFRSAVALAVMISSPFFAVYMLNSLHFSYIEFSAVLIIPIVMKVFSVTYWGVYSKKFGNKNILYVSALLVSLVPLLWLIAAMLLSDKMMLFIVILVAEAFSGFAWAGFELTTFNYTLDASEKKDRVRLFSYFTAILGVAVLVGGLLGSLIAKSLTFFTNEAAAILVIFFISFILRFLAVVIFFPKVNEVKVKKIMDHNKLLVQMILLEPLSFAMKTIFSSLDYLSKDMKHFRNQKEKRRR